MTKRGRRETLKQESIAWLRKRLRPGQKVYCILRSVSSTRMYRCISLYILHKGGLLPISFSAAYALGWPLKEKHGHRCIAVSGCGMDMGFHLVYSLSSVVFRKGFKLPKGAHGRNGDTSGYDKNGGYALKHEWI